MTVAALIAWLVTAAGGFYLLGTWLTKGGMRSSRFPKGVIFGHFALAALGLIVWIVYLVAGTQALAWVAFVLLVPIAALGFTMLARWVPTYRARATVGAGGGSGADAPAERHLPVVAVGAHGLVAVVTVVIVLLAALGVGTH
jgi:hypothetical protein